MSYLATAVLALVVPLLLTIAVELGVGGLVGLRGRRAGKAVVLVNLMTNPLLVLILLGAGRVDIGRNPGLLAFLEIAVVLVEWRLLRWALRVPSRRAALSSLAMNSASLAAGVLVMGLLAAPAPFSLPLPPGGGQTVAALEKQIRTAFGEELESVRIRYGTYWLRPTYFGSFKLKSTALEFRFQPTPAELEHSGLSSSALVDNTVIGGAKRFVLLAQAFSRDFPGPKTMYYAPVDMAASNPPEISAMLARRPGPSVVVYDRNWYWTSGRPKSLGLYTWDSSSVGWQLVHRGEVPDQW